MSFIQMQGFKRTLCFQFYIPFEYNQSVRRYSILLGMQMANPERLQIVLKFSLRRLKWRTIEMHGSFFPYRDFLWWGTFKAAKRVKVLVLLIFCFLVGFLDACWAISWRPMRRTYLGSRFPSTRWSSSVPLPTVARSSTFLSEFQASRHIVTDQKFREHSTRGKLSHISQPKVQWGPCAAKY